MTIAAALILQNRTGNVPVEVLTDFLAQTGVLDRNDSEEGPNPLYFHLDTNPYGREEGRPGQCALLLYDTIVEDCKSVGYKVENALGATPEQLTWEEFRSRGKYRFPTHAIIDCTPPPRDQRPAPHRTGRDRADQRFS